MHEHRRVVYTIANERNVDLRTFVFVKQPLHSRRFVLRHEIESHLVDADLLGDGFSRLLAAAVSMTVFFTPAARKSSVVSLTSSFIISAMVMWSMCSPSTETCRMVPMCLRSW